MSFSKILIKFRAILTAAKVKRAQFWAVVFIGFPVLMDVSRSEKPTSTWGRGRQNTGSESTMLGGYAKGLRPFHFT